MATPFQRPSPECTASYPSALSSLNGNVLSAHLVSCSATTSGCTSSSHGSSRGSRAPIELTFQVASLTDARLRSRGAGPPSAARGAPRCGAAELASDGPRPGVLEVDRGVGAQLGEAVLAGDAADRAGL